MSHSNTAVPPRLVELWLALCHQALCRRVEGGLLAWLPGDSDHFGSSRIAVHLAAETSHLVTAAAKSTFGEGKYTVHAIGEGSDGPFSRSHILTELQGVLLESDENLPEDAQLLAFLLKAGFRSSSAPVPRTVYHLVPEGDGWLLKLQGADSGDTFERKEDALKAGAQKARAHASGELVLHLANGRFEECRSYGEPSRD